MLIQIYKNHNSLIFKMTEKTDKIDNLENIGIKIPNIPPVFAHDVAVSTLFRSQKDAKGKIKNEAHHELLFIDLVTKQVISRITLPHKVFESLPKTIENALKKAKTQANKKQSSTSIKIEPTPIKNYLG